MELAVDAALISNLSYFWVIQERNNNFVGRFLFLSPHPVLCLLVDDLTVLPLLFFLPLFVLFFYLLLPSSFLLFFFFFQPALFPHEGTASPVLTKWQANFMANFMCNSSYEMCLYLLIFLQVKIKRWSPRCWRTCQRWPARWDIWTFVEHICRWDEGASKGTSFLQILACNQERQG